MYRFIIEKKEEFLQGRTITYIANKVGITVGYMTNILNGKRTTNKMTAYCIVKIGNENNEVENYFERVIK